MDQERHDELLTAYLDRELSPDERAAIDRLLDESPGAQQRLLDLEATSQFMRRLPRQQLDDNFANEVIERLGRESLLRPEPVVAPRRVPRWGGWVGGALAAAASLVLALWIGHGLQRNLGTRPAPARNAIASRERPNMAVPAEVAPFGEGLARADSLNPAESRFEQPRPGDWIRIVSETGDSEVGLIVLQEPSRERGLCGVLLETGCLPPRPDKNFSDESTEYPTLTFVAADVDVQKMADAVRHWKAQSTSPIVDLAYEAANDFDSAAGDSRPSVVMNESSLPAASELSREANKDQLGKPSDLESEERVASAKSAAPPAGALAETSGAVARGAARVVETPAGEPRSEPASRPEGGQVTDPSQWRVDGSPAARDNRSSRKVASAPRGRALMIAPGNDRRKASADPADKGDERSEPLDAKSDETLRDLKKLADDEPNNALKRSGKFTEPDIERITVLLQFAPSSDPARGNRRN